MTSRFSGAGPRTILLEPWRGHKGRSRFMVGAFAGKSHVTYQVKPFDGKSGDQLTGIPMDWPPARR